MAEPIIAVQASRHFFQSQDAEKAREARDDVEAFIEAFGPERPLSDMTSADVAAYAQRFRNDNVEDPPQLEPLRAFLAYAWRLSFTTENLVPALQLGQPEGVAEVHPAHPFGSEGYRMTLQGLQALERELEELKAQRPRIADELRAAMADKDFRENAPLDAARDAQAHLEARIRDIEGRLRHAVIIDPNQKKGRANVGSTVKLLNVGSEREQVFQLVSPSEVDPANGKISIESPVGSALMDHAPGDEVTVKAPSGTMRFKLIEVID